MTKLVVRKIPWEFDETVPFMWQPANPNFGLFCNAFTFIAVPFERYIVSAVRKAADRLNEDPEIAAEADAFLRQEAQHAAAHQHGVGVAGAMADREHGQRRRDVTR